MQIKLNGGGSETVDNLETLGPYNLIFDGSRRSGGMNTLDVPLTLPNFLVTMATDAAGDPQLQLVGGLIAIRGSRLEDQLNLTDNASSGSEDTFKILDDSALQGTLNLVGGREHDEFDVFNTPYANLETNLVGGSGQSSFYVSHGGVNENISITGGTGSQRPDPGSFRVVGHGSR